MMQMKKKRTIRLKDPRLRKVRTELRTLLSLMWQKQKKILNDQINEVYNDKSLAYLSKKKEVNQILEKIIALDRTYLHGLHGCRLCGRREPDLTYNPGDNMWYCDSCYEFNQDYYKRHPEEANWRKLYP